MEIAYRAVPPFNPRSHSATTTSTTSNPKKVWIEQLFPVELFGTDAEMFRQRFYALKGGNYYEVSFRATEGREAQLMRVCGCE